MTVDVSYIAGGITLAVLLGFGAAVVSTKIAITRLTALFEAHKERDEATFERQGKEIADVRETATAALYNNHRHEE